MSVSLDINLKHMISISVSLCVLLFALYEITPMIYNCLFIVYKVVYVQLVHSYIICLHMHY